MEYLAVSCSASASSSFSLTTNHLTVEALGEDAQALYVTSVLLGSPMFGQVQALDHILSIKVEQQPILSSRASSASLNVAVSSHIVDDVESMMQLLHATSNSTSNSTSTNKLTLRIRRWENQRSYAEPVTDRAMWRVVQQRTNVSVFMEQIQTLRSQVNILSKTENENENNGEIYSLFGAPFELMTNTSEISSIVRVLLEKIHPVLR